MKFKDNNTHRISSEEIIRCLTPSVEIISIDPNSEYNSPYYDDNNSSCSSSSCDDCSFGDESADDFFEEESENNCFKNNKFSIILSPKKNNIEENGMEIYALKSIENRSPEREINNIDLVSTQGKYLNSYIFDRVFDCCDNILTTENMDIDLDVKNFDLTTYITEDDCNLPSTNGKKIVLKTKPIRISSGKPSNYKKITNNLNRHLYPYNKNMKFDTDTDTDSDSEDSDESVDVETICDKTTSRSPEKFIIKTEKIDGVITGDFSSESISKTTLSSSAESNRSVVVSFSLFFFTTKIRPRGLGLFIVDFFFVTICLPLLVLQEFFS